LFGASHGATPLGFQDEAFALGGRVSLEPLGLRPSASFAFSTAGAFALAATGTPGSDLGDWPGVDDAPALGRGDAEVPRDNGATEEDFPFGKSLALGAGTELTALGE